MRGVLRWRGKRCTHSRIVCVFVPGRSETAYGWHNNAYFIMKVHSEENTRDTRQDGHAVAFFPRAFFGGRVFFSFCAAMRAEVRPRAACP